MKNKLRSAIWKIAASTIILQLIFAVSFARKPVSIIGKWEILEYHIGHARETNGFHKGFMMIFNQDGTTVMYRKQNSVDTSKSKYSIVTQGAHSYLILSGSRIKIDKLTLDSLVIRKKWRGSIHTIYLFRR